MRGNEALRDDRLEHGGKLQPDLFLLVRGIHRDDAVDRLRRIQGVKRRKHEVAGFGGQQRCLDRLEVAHFADEDDVGVLPQRAAQRVRERAGVDRHLALVHDRPAVAMKELDGILDRHHVRAARSVDVVDHRGQRRALAAARRAGHQHESALFFGDPAKHRRQQQVVDRQDSRGDDAKHHAHRAALLKHVDAKSSEAADAVRQVDFL